MLSGRALFNFDKTLFQDDENAADANAYEVIEEEEEKKADEKDEVVEESKVDEALFAAEADAAEEDVDFD